MDFLLFVVVCAVVVAVIRFALKQRAKQARSSKAMPVVEKLDTAIVEKPAAEPQSRQSVIFVDVETTGLDPAVDRITEICVIRVVLGQSEHNGKRTLINPSMSIPQAVVQLTGITDEMVKDAPTEECLREYFDFIGNDPVYAYNADFDMRFL